MDVLDVLVHGPESHGALLDSPKVEKLAREIEERLENVERRVHKAAGRVVDLNSTKQLCEWLYDERGLKCMKRTAPSRTYPEGQRSVDAEALSHHARKDSVVADLLEHAEWSKVLSTYLRPWMERQIDGQIYTDFVQYGTETGRFSSRKPNLQAVPRRGDKSELIRSLFIAPPGHVLVVADYSQIELRVLAHYSKDPTLLRVFREGEDPHVATAQLVFGVVEPTPEQRDGGKTTNFLVVYGGGAKRLSVGMRISETRARAVLRSHRLRFPRIYAWKDVVLRECRSKEQPHVTTLLGRKRLLPLLRSRDDVLRGMAERQAINTRIQGTAADIIKLAMVRLHRTSPADTHLVLTIHDELVVMAPEDAGERTVKLMQEAMEGVSMLDVPLRAEARVVTRWSDAKG
jgi:DNA polymerase-1